MCVFRPEQRRRTGPTWRSRRRHVGLVGTCVVLLVGYHCHPSAWVLVTESAALVELRLQIEGEGDDCAATVTVTSGSPLGDREIVDAQTGARVGGTDDVVP
jgi:hypothetical protein